MSNQHSGAHFEKASSDFGETGLEQFHHNLKQKALTYPLDDRWNLRICLVFQRAL